MNLNLIVLAGRLATTPDVRELDSGERLIRYLITVTSEPPRARVDVVPVIDRDPEADHLTHLPPPGRAVWVVGSVQRRFWEQDARRQSRLEVIARQIRFVDDAEPVGATRDDSPPN